MNIIILVLSTVFLNLWLYRTFRVRLEKSITVYEEKKLERQRLDADYEMLVQESACLKRSLDETVELYEITREISKFLQQDKVFTIFNEKIKKYLQLKDCRFFKAYEKLPDHSDWVVFPLGLGKRSLGSLAVRGLKAEDTDKFHILAHQFLLGLKRAVLYQHVQELATLDSLTHVFTRRYWFQRCKEEMERSRKFKYNLTCFMIDVDKFKDINDTYGHLVGDAVLLAVVKVVKENIRQVDLLGKYGGEEFCVILTETEAQPAIFVAERIRKALQDTVIQAYDENLKVTISIGIAGFPDDSADLTGLVDKADQALYRAKETGRNRVCVYKTS